MNTPRLLLILTILLAIFAVSACAIQPITAPEAAPEAAPVWESMMVEASLRAEESMMAEEASMPAVFLPTSPSYIAGTWQCGQGETAKVIRFDVDGTYHQVLGPNDSIPVGLFWFTGNEFHVVSDRDQANLEGVFEIFAMTEDGETYLSFTPCGGNCTTVDDIDWEAGMRLLLPPS
jgi:hypothetical protein